MGSALFSLQQENVIFVGFRIKMEWLWEELSDWEADFRISILEISLKYTDHMTWGQAIPSGPFGGGTS